ncbi:MAG: helix-turn-helix transcriptional regulator [Clostridia bacterium]|nr:helix-turn-helix transcriptional regulator [Clostridia bacterium]
MKLGKILKDLRKENKFTQNDICDELKKYGVYIERSTYAKYETDKRSVPCEVVVALSKIYEISTDVVLGCM